MAAVLVAACTTGGSAPSASASAHPSGSPDPGLIIDLPSAAPEALAADIPVPAVNATPAGEPGSALVTIEDGGTVTATADDGTVYTLVIDPGAVPEDVTVEVKPLTGTTGFGEIFAGADFAPAGLQLTLPATLTVELGDRTAPSDLVGIGFSGDAASSTGRLLAGAGGETGSDVLRFNVSHFSGSVASRTGDSTASLEVAYWQARNSTTPADRQAAAEVLYAAADHAQKDGRISKETADGIKDRADTTWLEAEAERLGSEGDPADLTTIQDSLARTAAHERDVQLNGGTGEHSKLNQQIIKAAESRIKAISDKLSTKELQAAADSGRITDLNRIHELIVALLACERQLQLFGKTDSDLQGLLLEFNRRVADGLEKSCAQAPLPPDMLLGFRRVAALFGDEEGAQVDINELVRKCTGEEPSSLVKPPKGPIAADGTITFTHAYDWEQGQESRHETYEVKMNVRLRQGQETLIFAKGSTFTATRTQNGTRLLEGGEIGPAFPGCPATYSWSGVLGSMLVDGGWDPDSDPAPEGYGWGLEDNGTIELNLGVGEDDWTLSCDQPFVAIECAIGDPIKGMLVDAQPYTWSFACSDFKDGTSVSVKGVLVQVSGG